MMCIAVAVMHMFRRPFPSICLPPSHQYCSPYLASVLCTWQTREDYKWKGWFQIVYVQPGEGRREASSQAVLGRFTNTWGSQNSWPVKCSVFSARNPWVKQLQKPFLLHAVEKERRQKFHLGFPLQTLRLGHELFEWRLAGSEQVSVPGKPDHSLLCSVSSYSIPVMRPQLRCETEMAKSPLPHVKGITWQQRGM